MEQLSDPVKMAISIHALLAESDISCSLRYWSRANISIHALLAESDRKMIVSQVRVQAISIHALLAESDQLALCPLHHQQHFYPRSPCGERQIPYQRQIDQKNFYPRSPCGERLSRASRLAPVISISIHALLAESDLLTLSMGVILILFLSTLSLRRATAPPTMWSTTTTNFYPRSPCGERQIPYQRQIDQKNFYPRSPCGERLSRASRLAPVISISIHALLAESDLLTLSMGVILILFLSTLSLRRATAPPTMWSTTTTNFYPRSPCGERQPAENHANSRQEFLSTLSLRRATVIREPTVARNNKFLSTLSLRRATLIISQHSEPNSGISIHALLAESDKHS